MTLVKSTHPGWRWQHEKAKYSWNRWGLYSFSCDKCQSNGVWSLSTCPTEAFLLATGSKNYLTSSKKKRKWRKRFKKVLIGCHPQADFKRGIVVFVLGLYVCTLCICMGERRERPQLLANYNLELNSLIVWVSDFRAFLACKFFGSLRKRVTFF